MHELPITQGILETAVTAAQQAGAQRITAIDLVIGALSSVVDDSVQFYFDLLSQGTLAEGATLRFRRTPASATCLDCGFTFEATLPLAPACPACDSPAIRVEGGREFFVESIEIDDDDNS